MKNRCISCERTSDDVPLIPLEYRNATFYICPQHLPILIHSPAKLAGKLPDAEYLRPSEMDH